MHGLILETSVWLLAESTRLLSWVSWFCTLVKPRGDDGMTSFVHSYRMNDTRKRHKLPVLMSVLAYHKTKKRRYSWQLIARTSREAQCNNHKMLLVVYLNINYRYQSQTIIRKVIPDRRLCNWYVSVIGGMPKGMDRCYTHTGVDQEQPKGNRTDQLYLDFIASHGVAVNQHSLYSWKH